MSILRKRNTGPNKANYCVSPVGADLRSLNGGDCGQFWLTPTTLQPLTGCPNSKVDGRQLLSHGS
jgi:hypothetical protein